MALNKGSSCTVLWLAKYVWQGHQHWRPDWGWRYAIWNASLRNSSLEWIDGLLMPSLGIYLYHYQSRRRWVGSLAVMGLCTLLLPSKGAVQLIYTK